MLDYLRRARWVSAIVVGITHGGNIVLAWWLGWTGVSPSAVGIGVGIGAIALLVLEFLAWWLASRDYNIPAVAVATLVGMGIVGFFSWLAPLIGWAAAAATVAVLLIWATSVSAAYFLRD